MAAGTALKKINARAKQLKKKHPNAKYKTLQKQAGAEYRSGKLKAKRKAAPKKKRAVKRRKVSSAVGAVRRKKVRRAIRPRVVVIASPRKRRRKVAKKKSTGRRRVGSPKMGMGALLLGGLALGAVYLLTRPKTPQIIYTQNATRNSQAQTLLQAAQTAGMTAAAIANLIKVINASSDSQVAAAAADPQQALRDAANAAGDFGVYGVGSYLVRN